MKTTINLPDEMLRRAKVVAAERRTTLRELVIRGLAHAIDSPDERDRRRKERADRLLAALEGKNRTSMKLMTREEIHGRG